MPRLVHSRRERRQRCLVKSREGAPLEQPLLLRDWIPEGLHRYGSNVVSGEYEGKCGVEWQEEVCLDDEDAFLFSRCKERYKGTSSSQIS